MIHFLFNSSRRIDQYCELEWTCEHCEPYELCEHGESYQLREHGKSYQLSEHNLFSKSTNFNCDWFRNCWISINCTNKYWWIWFGVDCKSCRTCVHRESCEHCINILSCHTNWLDCNWFRNGWIFVEYTV